MAVSIEESEIQQRQPLALALIKLGAVESELTRVAVRLYELLDAARARTRVSWAQCKQGRGTHGTHGLGSPPVRHLPDCSLQWLPLLVRKRSLSTAVRGTPAKSPPSL